MRKLAAVLVLVAAVVGGWWFFQSRVVNVWVYTDYSFRFNHADWPALVDSRFKEVNRIYLRNSTGVRWKLVNSAETDPTSDISGIDNRRATMVLHIDDKADVFVVLTGIHEGDRTGSVSPFTRVAMVVDFPDKSESLNGRLLAHELAHLFGAPHDPAWLESLMADKPESNKLSPRTVALIRRMRNYPFVLGIDGLSQDGWEKKALAALAEDDTGPHANPQAHAHAVIGTALVNERKVEAGLAHFRQAVQADPRNVMLRFTMAEAYVRNGQDDLALREVREVARLAPDSPLSHRALGAMLGRNHQPEEALQELRIAARLEPQNADIQVLMGLELGSMFGHLDDAIAALQEAIRMNPDASLARESLAQAETVKKLVAEELVTERSRVQRNPSDSDAHYRLAKAEARAGDLAGAILDYQKSADLRPDNGTPHADLAELYFLKGDFATAWAEVRKARALGTEPPPALIARLPPQK
jgi:Flp pilus assembly protein TadD